MATNIPSSQFNILTSPYVENFTSISGSDIVGVFGHVEFINLQGVSVSVNREVHPIYVMGRTDPISFVRGKRGVAGSIVTVAADRGSLYDIIDEFGVYAKSNGDNHVPGTNQLSLSLDPLQGSILDEFDRLGYVLTKPVYYDQLPPFDITLIGRNENLSATISRIGGVFIVSMGTGISVDDNSIEQQMTFVALFYEDWRPAGRRNFQNLDRENQAYNPFAIGNQGQQIINAAGINELDGLGRQFGLNPALRTA